MKITIPTIYLIRDVLYNKDALSRVQKWSVELAQYDIKFVARKSVKAGILVDFIAEWTPHGELDGQAAVVPEEPVWTVFTGGAWGVSGAGCLVVIKSPGGQVLHFSAALYFKTTNNHSLWARRLILFSDSQLAFA